MSVPSSKSMTMLAIAYLAIERTTRCFGMPGISTSIGATMRVSTSSGVMPGAFTMISTCVLETSGNASIGRPESACTPAITSSSVSADTSRRWVSERATRRASIVSVRCR